MVRFAFSQKLRLFRLLYCARSLVILYPLFLLRISLGLLLRMRLRILAHEIARLLLRALLSPCAGSLFSFVRLRLCFLIARYLFIKDGCFFCIGWADFGVVLFEFRLALLFGWECLFVVYELLLFLVIISQN